MENVDYPGLWGLTPSPSEVVMYQNDGRGGFEYAVPAIISVTVGNLVPSAVEQGLLSGLDSEWHVHLVVFGPGSVYFEQNVPYDNGRKARTWHRP